MTWIRTIGPEEATGTLKRLYDAALQRAGRIYNIIRIQSLRPRVLRSSTQLYIDVMRSADSGLTSVQREMIALTVSWANGCHY
ncbi:MAG: carboxymuconolactone decarboxylase family protein [Acidobacteriota bacterium]